MFTGIVEEIGRVTQARSSTGGMLLIVGCSKVVEGTRVGDSICVDGVCLTVTDLGEGSFQSEVAPETLSKTTLGRLRPGSRVNLERALRLGDRLGGHFVTGHVDAVGRIKEKRRAGISIMLEVEVPDDLARYVVPRGSVALDGISLTVAEKNDNRMSISVIPHTMQNTTLGEKRVGDEVNLEIDLIGRYVEAFVDREARGGLNRDILARSGFLT